MFKFLKEKLKNSIQSISKKIKEQRVDEEITAELNDKKEKVREEEQKIKEKETQLERKGVFSKLKEAITTQKINKEQFDKLFWDLEIVLLENNVAVEVIEKIKNDLAKEIVDKPLPRMKIDKKIKDALKTTIGQLLNIEPFNFLKKVKEKKPFVICFIGINGSGKTTSIAKITKLLKDNNLTAVLVAGDTWRKAAIEQIEEWARHLNVPLVKHSYGSDPAAVAYDGIAMAKARGIDTVLIDTAGRMHSNVNLMDELKKVVRVAKPDLKIFVGESITGNDCCEQSKMFDAAVGIDGIILSKTDVDEKGGTAISISYVTKKPIIYFGVGQKLDDLKEFESSIVINNLGL